VTTDFDNEFETVQLLTNCGAETRGVDAFALSVIKAERQMRRLFTYLIFQFSCFGPSDTAMLRNVLTKQRGIYFDGFIKGVDALYPKPVKNLIGLDYDRLRTAVDDAIAIRNKIFHGQVTDRYLSREDLFSTVDQIMEWCQLLAETAVNEFEYDGFARNSYRKAANPNLSASFKRQISSVAEYEAFLTSVLSR
jgi:hypothetical protein